MAAPSCVTRTCSNESHGPNLGLTLTVAEGAVECVGSYPARRAHGERLARRLLVLDAVAEVIPDDDTRAGVDPDLRIRGAVGGEDLLAHAVDTQEADRLPVAHRSDAERNARRPADIDVHGGPCSTDARQHDGDERTVHDRDRLARHRTRAPASDDREAIEVDHGGVRPPVHHLRGTGEEIVVEGQHGPSGVRDRDAAVLRRTSVRLHHCELDVRKERGDVHPRGLGDGEGGERDEEGQDHEGLRMFEIQNFCGDAVPKDDIEPR